MKWYGSLDNRLEEGRMFCNEIKVGTGMTEYFYSDRKAYEVVAVKDQKHVSVRRYDHVHEGDGCMDNSWKLVSNENNPVREISKRGDVWYWTTTVNAKDFEDVIGKEINGDNIEKALWLVHNGIDVDKLAAKGKVTKYRKANVSFGVAEYYYDYEF